MVGTLLSKPAVLEKEELDHQEESFEEFPKDRSISESHRIQPRDSEAQTLSQFGNPVCINVL